MEFSPVVRRASIERMKRQIVDVVVIGGGITGAGIARDAALRGLSVALVEKDDFASGTSSKTSRMVHGGVRYLEQLQLGVVAEACAERRTLHRIAPRLVCPLPFTFPVYGDSRNGLSKIRLGMWLYDILAQFRNFRRHRILNPQQIANMEPTLRQRDLIGGAYYYDCRTDDARLTLATVQSAQQHGALIANHAEVRDLLREKGRVSGAQVVDRVSDESFTVRARVTVNATGAWCDSLRQMDEPGVGQVVHPSRGSHLVVPRQRLSIREAIIFTSVDGGRAMFAVPWGDTCVLGTTDADHPGSLEKVYATAAEVDIILTAANHAFPEAKLTETDIISTYAGVRPLVTEEGRTAYQVSRTHRIFESDSGLVSIAGGKLTTYRKMAEELVDLACEKLKARFGVVTRQGSRTAQLALTEAALEPDLEVARLAERHSEFEHDVLAHLALSYGSAISNVLALAEDDASMRSRIVAGLPYVRAEVPYAIQYEMALDLSDFLIRRTHIIYEDKDQGMECASDVASIMAQYLGWDSVQMSRQLEQYRGQVELTQAFRKEAPREPMK
jgi:glycerol-3-phosphate dehydrogenase